MQNYEKHDFDYALFEAAVLEDSVCQQIRATLRSDIPYHERYRLLQAYDSRKRELAKEVADFRGLSVLGKAGCSSELVDDLFSGKLPPLGESSDASAYDLKPDHSESDAFAASLHSVGGSISEQVSPYSFAARRGLRNVLESAREEYGRRNQSSAPDGTPSPTGDSGD